MSTHTRQGPPKVTVWTGLTVESRIVLDNDIFTLSVEGSVEGPTYKWALTLLPRGADNRQTPGDIRRVSVLYKRLRANQVVSIGFERRGGITLGLIDSVRRTAQHGGPNAAVGLQITGSGIGKVLARDSVIRATLNVADYPDFRAKVEAALGENNPVIFDIPGVWGPQTRDGVPTFLGVSVQNVVDWLLANAPSMRLPVLAPATGGTGLPSDYIGTTKSVTTWNDGRVWSETLSDYQGSVWGFIRGILDADFYEAWVDTTPPRDGSEFPTVHLVIRPKPFDEPSYEFAPVAEETGLTWDDLRTMVDGLPHHDIALDEVVSENLGVDDSNAYAYFAVTSQYDLIANTEAQSRGLFYPLLDTYIAKKFGMAKYDARVSLVGGDIVKMAEGDDDYTTEVSSEVFEARNRLFNWYRLNPYYETGSVVVVGRDSYRPGDPVRLDWVELQYGLDRGASYYCPAVRWSWQHGGHYLCTLTLTRGHNAGMMTELQAEILADAPTSNPSHYASTG